MLFGVPLQSSPAVAGRPAGVTLASSDDDGFATAGVATAAFTALDPPAKWVTKAQPYIDKAKADLSTTATTPTG